MNGAAVAFHARHADTSHVRATRKLWLNHLEVCGPCHVSFDNNDLKLCEQGQVMYDEYMTAIKNHPDNEHCEGVQA